MTQEQIALARRAVACRGWRWMPGMLALCPDGTNDPVRLCFGSKAARMGSDDRWVRPSYIVSHELPDLADPATLGCLLALVREAYGDPSLYARLSDTTRQSDGVRAWEVLGWLDPMRSPDCRGGSWRGWGYASEAEALVAALKAAP